MALGDRLPRETAKERVRTVRDFGADAANRYRADEVSKYREVIVEEDRPEGLKGLTETFVQVILKGSDAKPGDLIRVLLEPSEDPHRLLAIPADQ